MTDLSREFADLLAKMPRGERPLVSRGEPCGFGAASAQVVCQARRTRRKLERLSQLVRRSSLFEDATEEISSLIRSANDEVTLASTKFRAAKADNSQQQQKKKTAVAAHVASIEQAVTAEIEETSRFFKAVLRRRSETMRQQHERREVFGKKTERARIPVFDDVQRPPPPPSRGVPEDATTRKKNGGGGLSQQQQELLIPDRTYQTSRASATADVEAQVQELGNIFGKLTSLISQQDELVERIELNVEDANANVDATATLLRGRLSNMSDSATTAVKVASILAATAVIYTVFLA
eukprot:CAMPEP_0118903396 /NCGR_PEP_ID=MMETSP1166-20130328/8273_1 /TAXON_ID=1104430 /ORGANISM="Chrysoreinhardia sp, Strain CCMP3193" /LENGTH=293 /DNA_ID=CAMNT_0006842623 /DNA_START=15 /DNA_END=896 /DNA_ORIENTATION=+